LGSLSFGSSTSTVGLDIGTDHVRAVQLRPAGDGFALTAYGVVEMPMGAVVEGEIVDIDAVTSAIKEVWRRSGVRGKDVSIGVSNQKVIVRLIDLPFMEHAELAGAIQYQAQDYIPMAIEESILDFQIIGDYMTPSDEHMMEVLLVAAHREMIGASVAAVEGAGLKLSQIDVSSFAIVRALMGPISMNPASPRVSSMSPRGSRTSPLSNAVSPGSTGSRRSPATSSRRRSRTSSTSHSMKPST
jgi:type IV pilus assembly protein PilM